MTDTPDNLQPAIQRVYADHRRIVKDKNRQINALQAEKGELQRALQAKAAEVVRAKMQAAEAFGTAADEAERGSDLAADLAAAVVRADRAEKELDEARGTVEALRTVVRERGTLIKDLRARAENAERQWNEADRRTAEAEEQRDQWKRHHDRVDGQWAKAEREVTKLRLAAESRPLTPDAITEAGTSRFIYSVRDAGYDAVMRIPYRVLMDGMHAALTEPPARPEGAEKVEKVLNRYWSGDISGDDLADRIAEEMNR